MCRVPGIEDVKCRGSATRSVDEEMMVEWESQEDEANQKQASNLGKGKRVERCSDSRYASCGPVRYALTQSACRWVLLFTLQSESLRQRSRNACQGDTTLWPLPTTVTGRSSRSGGAGEGTRPIVPDADAGALQRHGKRL